MRDFDEIVSALINLKDEFLDYDDSIYDNIYYQLVGLEEDDANDEKLMADMNMLVDQLEVYLHQLKNKPNFNWIFG